MVLNRTIPGIIFIIVAIILLLETNNFPDAIGRDVGTAYWPRVLAVILIIFSVLLIATGFKKPQNTPNEKKKWNLTYNDLKPYLGMVLSILFVLLFKPLGFLLSILLFYVLLSTIMYGKFEWKFISIGLVQGIGLIIIVYLVFSKFLSVNLPTGIFGI